MTAIYLKKGDWCMNVNGNSTRWFLQSSMSKFFSQKNLNKSDISGQTATNPNSGVKYKHSYLYYNENGVPCFSKEQAERCLKGRTDCRNIVSVSEQVKADLAEVVKQDFVSTNGWGIPKGSKRHDVVNNYLSTLPAKQCASASWTLIKMAGDYAERLQALVRENNPGWKPGDAFDTNILDQLDGTLGGVDFKV